MTTATRRRHAPSTITDPAQEAWISGHRLDYEPIDMPLDLVDFETSQHNQARVSGALNEDQVVLYATSMENGDQFPPVVVYQRKDGKFIVIDGNHRLVAASMINVKSFPAYLVMGPSETQIKIMTYEANTRQGLPTSLDERIWQALDLIGSGASLTEAAKILGVPFKKVQDAFARDAADRRAMDLGISRRWWDLSSTIRRRMSAVHSDVTYVALANFAIDSGISVTDFQNLIPRINGERSEAAQLAMIGKEVEARKDEIAATDGARVMRGSSGLSSELRALINVARRAKRLNLDSLTNQSKGIGTDLRLQVRKDLLLGIDNMTKALDVLHGGK